jgi:predicted dinucleotide-binding enzyme
VGEVVARVRLEDHARQRAGEEVERLIRTAGFEPVKAGGIEQSGRLEVGGDLHDLVVGPTQARSLIGGA